MPQRRQQLGDSHNFGRRVSLNAERVLKPRTLLWEWLLLAKDSPLRRRLNEIARAAGLGPKAFGFLPKLRFHAPSVAGGGEVQRLQLAPLRSLSVASPGFCRKTKMLPISDEGRKWPAAPISLNSAFRPKK